MKSSCGSSLYWYGCYKDSYDLIAPESYAHPAKMSPALCFKILSHLEDLGLLKQDDTVLDCMAGTGLTNICAGAKGYKTVSIELEEKFIGFEKQNKQYAESKLFKSLDWTILQGDSRKLSELIKEKYVSLMSPPYSEALTGGGINKKGYTGNKHSPTDFVGQRTYSATTHGQSLGQIGNLKDRPLVSITSPPHGFNPPDLHTGKSGPIGNKSRKSENRKGNTEIPTGQDYGQSAGQIGSLPDKPLVSVMSPPYEDALESGSRHKHKDPAMEKMGGYIVGASSNGNIGDTYSESYLSAMKQVYSEIAKVSNVLAIVIKNPTRNKQLRRLDLDTIEILKQSGWTIYCQHRALLFEELEQGHLFDGAHKKVKGRMSFFKRLSWQNGQPVASWEDIIVAVR